MAIRRDVTLLHHIRLVAIVYSDTRKEKAHDVPHTHEVDSFNLLHSKRKVSGAKDGAHVAETKPCMGKVKRATPSTVCP